MVSPAAPPDTLSDIDLDLPVFTDGPAPIVITTEEGAARAPRALADAAEIARMALFLASNESSFCTGADFVVDGGVSAGKPRS